MAIPEVKSGRSMAFELTMEEVVALFAGATLGDPTFNEYGTFIRLEGNDESDR